MASRSLGSLTVDVIAKVGGFTKGMTQAERQAEKSSKVIEQRMRKLGKGIDAALQIAGAAALAATAAITVGVGNAINRLDEIGKASQKVGITTDALSKLAYAAKLADVDFQTLQGGLTRLTKAQDAAAQGTGAQLDLFRALGVEFQNQDGTLRNTADVLADLADKFQALPDDADKTAAALGLLGKSGAGLIPLLNGGSEALRDAGDELERFGGVVTPEAAKQAEEFNDNVTRLKVALEGMWQAIAQEVLPSLVDFTEKTLDATTRGEGLVTVVDTVKELMRGFGLTAQLAVDGVQALTLSAIGLFNVLSAVSRLNVTGLFRDGSVGEDLDNAGAAFGLARGAFDESSQNFFGGGPAPTYDIEAGLQQGQDYAEEAKREMGAAAAAKKLADALKEQRDAAAKAAAAKQASAAASRAQAEADRELKRIMDEGKQVSEDLAKLTAENAAQLAGPAAEAARAYADDLLALVAAEDKLRTANMLSSEEQGKLALARDQANQKYQLDLEKIEEQRTEVFDSMMSDLAFETELLGMNSEAREKAIALRYLGAEATDAEREALSAALDELEEKTKRTEGIEFARDTAKGLFEDLTDDVGSAKDAVDDFFDNLRAKAMQVLADKLFDGLFDSFSGGGGGGGIGDFLGSLFGGARAGGGPVYPGKAYLVGEEGPELIRPMGAAMVSTAGETARMGRGGPSIINNFQLPGRYDMRTQAQIATDAGRSTQRALARGTA